MFSVSIFLWAGRFVAPKGFAGLYRSHSVKLIEQHHR
jgi:hypothetical protein